MLRTPIIAGLMLAATPALAQEKPLEAGDAAAFVGQLREMGYAPEPLTVQNDIPSTIIKDGDDQYALTFGGCTDSKSCRYITLVGAFTDVSHPPADWVARENSSFDLIKVWTNDDGKLLYSSAAVIAGWPRANFRDFMEVFHGSAWQLAKDAIDAKLIK